MHRLRNKVLLFVPTAAAALAALGLHRYMMENCIDHMGLLIPGNLPLKLLWVLGIGFPGYLLILLSTLGGRGSYGDNFPRSIFNGGLMLAAGVVLLLSARELGAAPVVLLPEQTHALSGLVVGLTDRLMAVLPWLAGAAMILVGLSRMAGKKPLFVFSGSVCLLHMLTLVHNYRFWSADPQLHEYCFPLLAMVLLLLCSFHRTCCDAGIFQRRKLIFTGMTAAVCAAAALSSGFQPGFFLASALWALGCVCDPAVLPPDPEEEEVQAEEGF
jgi:hypothetical protein